MGSKNWTTSKDFIDTKSSFCNQSNLRCNNEDLQEQAARLARSELDSGRNVDGGGERPGQFANRFLQGTPINEVSYLCPHIIYSFRGILTSGKLLSDSVPKQFRYLFVDEESRLLADIYLNILEECNVLGFSSFGSCVPGANGTARIITKAAKMPELEGYEFRRLEVSALMAVWFHSENPEKSDFIVPITSCFGLKEGVFYTEEEVTNELLNEIIPYFNALVYDGHDDL